MEMAVLNWENINECAELKGEKVLINANIIYWKYSEAIQKKDNDIADILFNIINGISNERFQHVAMRAEDIKKCFQKENITNRETCKQDISSQRTK